MVGWMDDEWMDAWVDGLIDVWMDGFIHACLAE